jgi:chorismate mutase/prephenate dehydratase
MKEKDVAAVAGEKAAHLMGLRVLQSDIQDRTDNVTKFFVVGHAVPRPTGKDRTTLAFWIKNRPGSLSEVLKIITAHGINVTKIESRPLRGPGAWEYVFFIDLAGHHQDASVRECLDELEKRAVKIQILGSYPAADNTPASSA